MGVLRRLDRWQRLQLVVSILLCLALVVTIKRISSTSCPWDLAEFGGVARHVSHWRFGVPDGGGAHCFPAGWTGWLCWTVAWACHSLVTTWRLRSGGKRSPHVVA